MNSTQPYRLIISGGGTGGHIFPAIAIADSFREKYPDAKIKFVGAQGKMEMDRVPKAGYEIEGLWISGLQRKLTLKNLLFPVKLLASLLKAKRIIRDFKPHVVVGTGGFASGPIMIAATNAGVPTMIQEQNSFAGLANKNVGRKVSKICVAYDNMERFFPADKIALTGNPVRKIIGKDMLEKKESLKEFKLIPDKTVVLILGGSLGARTINDSVMLSLEEWTKNGLQVIWQTGKLYYQEMKEKAARFEERGVKILEFIDDMRLAYAAADIIVSRAGAISVSEHCLVQKPVIYVPSPNVAEDHQTKNAQALVEKDAAEVVPDKDARSQLVSAVLNLEKDKKRQQELIRNIGQMARPNATDDIVKEIEKLIN